MPRLKLIFAQLNCVDMSLKSVLCKFSQVTVISERKTNHEVKRNCLQSSETALRQDPDLWMVKLKIPKSIVCSVIVRHDQEPGGHSG